MMTKIYFFIIIILIQTGCGEVNFLSNTDVLIGTWIHKEYRDEMRVLYKSRDFENDKYGFRLNPDNTFIERKNSGWCGTPPISYANFDGKWTKIDENKYSIEVGYWGGIEKYVMEITSISATEVAIKYHYESN